MSQLIVFAGLPGVGKSSIARRLAARRGAIWLRIDSMDQAIWAAPTAPKDLCDWTYRAAQAVAVDNLSLGRDVLADCVNDGREERNGWGRAGARAGAEVKWVEIVCSDPVEHRRRTQTRLSDIAGLVLPDWRAVIERPFDEWDWDRAVIDTAGRSIDSCVDEAFSFLQK